jgi:hypothetical protein
VVGCRTFHHATWNGQHVTLVINTGAVPSSTLALGSSSIASITEFSDLIADKFLTVNNDDSDKYVQGRFLREFTLGVCFTVVDSTVSKKINGCGVAFAYEAATNMTTK